MSAAELLSEHAAWLRGEVDGRRLVWCELSGFERANLRGADLRGANLGDADLGDADLGDADLRGADLRGANLCAANLGETNLCEVAGLVELPTGDARGYRAFAVLQADGEWRVFAGCRGPWPVSTAREHWGSDDYPDNLRAARYLRALDWWESDAADADREAAGAGNGGAL